jgi:hypothetical protein
VKRTLVTIMLLGLLVLTSYQVNAITPTVLPVPAAQELYMPRNVQMAYEERTRSPDGNPGEKYWQNKAVHSMSITVAPPNRTVRQLKRSPTRTTARSLLVKLFFGSIKMYTHQKGYRSGTLRRISLPLVFRLMSSV